MYKPSDPYLTLEPVSVFKFGSGRSGLEQATTVWELRTLLFDKKEYQVSFKFYTRIFILFRSIIIV